MEDSCGLPLSLDVIAHIFCKLFFEGLRVSRGLFLVVASSSTFSSTFLWIRLSDGVTLDTFLGRPSRRVPKHLAEIFSSDGLHELSAVNEYHVVAIRVPTAGSVALFALSRRHWRK